MAAVPSGVNLLQLGLVMAVVRVSDSVMDLCMTTHFEVLQHDLM